MKKLFMVIIISIITQTTYGQWNRATGIDDRFVYSIRKIENHLFAATDSGVFRSSNGKDWFLKIEGMDTTLLNTRDFCKNGNNLYAASMTGLYVSTNNGDNWQITNYPHPGTPAISVYAINNIIMASTTGGGLYRSANYGVTWIPVSGDNYWKYVMINGTLFASTYQNVSLSLDTGATWQSTYFNDWAFDLININDTLLATTFSNSIAETPCNNLNWKYLDELQIHSAVEFARKSDTIFACTADSIFSFINRTKPANRLNLDGLNIFPENKISTIEIFNNLLLVGTENTSTLLGKGIWYYSLDSLSNIPGEVYENTVEIFPNPANNLIYLRIKEKSVYQLDILNMHGQMEFSTKQVHQTMIVDVGRLKNGMYLIKAITKNGNVYFIKKFIKN